jgi:hypothetical protein
MARKPKKVKIIPRIPVKELEVGCVYKSFVLDLVKILEISEERQTVVIFNITGAYRQWKTFKQINLIEKIR